MWRACVAKKHMGPHIKARSWRCFNATRLLKPHKTPPTQACDWQLHGDTETASLSNIQHTHTHTTHRYLSVFYLNGVKHLHKWEASQYMYLTKKKVLFFFFKFSCKEKKILILFFKPFLYILWDMFWHKNRSQKCGLAPDKMPTYFTHPPTHPPTSPKK